MKKKIYIQSRFIIHITSFSSFLIGLLIALLVFFDDNLNINKGNFLNLVIAAIGSILFIFESFRLERNVIILKKECVFMRDDWRIFILKRQRRTRIGYKEIADISLCLSKEDSSKRKVISLSIYDQIESRKYLVLKNKNGEEKRFFVHWHTDKRIISIIDEIRDRMKQCENEAIIPNGKKIIEDFNKIKQI